MELHLKKRIVGALLTVTAFAMVLPVVLDGKRQDASMLQDVPPMPELPDWAVVEDERRVRIELQQLASGETGRVLQQEIPELVSQDAAVPPRSQSDRTMPDEQGVPYAWTLQLGAFSDVNNANTLRDQLRGQGYKAYTEVSADSGLTRVYVGPELQRAAIESLQKKLQQEMQQGDIYIKRYQPGR